MASPSLILFSFKLEGVSPATNIQGAILKMNGSSQAAQLHSPALTAIGLVNGTLHF